MTTGRKAGQEAAGRRAHPCPAVASYHPAMAAAFPITRRLFLVDLGRAGVAVTVLGLAGCATSTSGSPSSRAAASTSSSADGASDAGSPGSSTGSATDAATGGGSSGGASADGPTSWHRVDLGFVSAYVLARGGEAAVVDTGVPGSEGAILEALEAAGLGWSDVGHVILTHRHQDHVGSAPAVLDAAPDAAAYAGAADIPAIDVPRALVPVADGDRVFGLRILATPGHTNGHVSVLDEAGGVLVAGDALATSGGKPTPPNPGFSVDMDEAMASIARLGSLAFETLLVGHGEPIESGAAALVKALAAG